jgi:hypothetical protein
MGKASRGLIRAVAALLLPSCGSSELVGPPVKTTSVEEVDASAWSALAKQRIYFGHQSVGFDLLAGVRDVAAAHARIELRVVEGKDAARLDGPVLLHSRIGMNEQPRTKIDDFVRTIEGGLGERLDIAAMKLCYIDFDPDTDVQQLFEHYRAAIARLRERYPRLAVVHVTVPLKQVGTGPRAQLKALLGRPNPGIAANRKRAEFSRLLAAEYPGAVFDLAEIESTAADGRRLRVSFGGEAAPALLPEYTNDGGHLNERGRTRAAGQFLVFLAAAAAARAEATAAAAPASPAGARSAP